MVKLGLQALALGRNVITPVVRMIASSMDFSMTRESRTSPTVLITTASTVSVLRTTSFVQMQGPRFRCVVDR